MKSYWLLRAPVDDAEHRSELFHVTGKVIHGCSFLFGQCLWVSGCAKISIHCSVLARLFTYIGRASLKIFVRSLCYRYRKLVQSYAQKSPRAQVFNRVIQKFLQGKLPAFLSCFVHVPHHKKTYIDTGYCYNLKQIILEAVAYQH